MSAPVISTPCVKVCVIDPVSSLCVGCGRSTAEIATWLEMSEGERLTIMAGLPARLVAQRSRSTRGGRVRGRS